MIEEKLKEKAQGMYVNQTRTLKSYFVQFPRINPSRFRWVFCQLNTLKKCRKMSTLKDKLDQLPKDLDETYSRILQSIEEEDSKEALAALKWLAFSERPLSLNELTETVVLGPSIRKLSDRDLLRHPTEVLAICSSLIVVGNDKCWATKPTRLIRKKKTRNCSAAIP
jgi:hypothetical protein